MCRAVASTDSSYSKSFLRRKPKAGACVGGGRLPWFPSLPVHGRPPRTGSVKPPFPRAIPRIAMKNTCALGTPCGRVCVYPRRTSRARRRPACPCRAPAGSAGLPMAAPGARPLDVRPAPYPGMGAPVKGSPAGPPGRPGQSGPVPDPDADAHGC